MNIIVMSKYAEVRVTARLHVTYDSLSLSDVLNLVNKKN